MNQYVISDGITGEEIKAIRRKLKLTQAAFAEPLLTYAKCRKRGIYEYSK